MKITICCEVAVLNLSVQMKPGAALEPLVQLLVISPLLLSSHMLSSLHAKMEELNSIMLSRYIQIKPFVKTVVTSNSKSEKYPFPSRRHGLLLMPENHY